MKKLIIILLSLTVINTMAQKDTIYFNKHWEKVTKDKAKYYRIVPLKKIGDLHQITDYYMNGNPQMEGFWSDIKNEIFEGETKWYFKNGTLSEITNYKNGLKEGLSKSYLITGELKTSGTYKKDKPFNGTFIPPCASCDVSEYKEGIKTKYYQYYRDTNKIAEKSVVNTANEIIKQTYYDRDGKQIGEVTMKFYESPIDGKIVYFDIDNDKHIIGISNTAHFKDKKLEGEAIDYNLKTGEILAKGIYKSGAPYNGTFSNYLDNNITTYKNGVKDGEVILFSDKREFIGKGVYKNGERWSGHFYDVYYNSFKTIVNYKEGEMLGKQVSYYTTNFEKIAETSHIKNGEKDGKVASYNKEGKLLAKGIYKDNKQWSGSFYDFYTYELTSYKKGKKHGKYIQYATDGKILSQQEYENGELGGTIVSTGYFADKTCECIYKKGEPYKGKVCNDNFIITYKKGIVTKRIEYDYDDLKTIKSITEYKDEIRYKETYFVNGKKYVLINKEGKSYDGVQYNPSSNAFYTFKEGLLEGAFSMSLDYYSSIIVSGNYKNNKHHGIIKFENKNANKIATCTYEYGKPIDGKVFTELGELNYKDGLKIGKEVAFESVYLYKNGERELIYDFVEKEYKKGKIEGKVTYFIGDSLVNSNSYKNGKPYNGTFYEDQKFTLKYKNGDLQTLTANPNPYTVTEYYTNNKIAKVEATKENTKPYIAYYHLGEKHNGTFLNFDDKRFPIRYIIATYKDGLKNGLEKEIDIANDFKETLIHTKTYKKGKLTHEEWHNYYVNASQNVQGSFKDEKRFNGHFYSIENNAFNVFHYKNGIKEGQQYAGYLDKLAFVKTDSISYKNGKPFQGNKVTSKYKFKFLQQYEKGAIVKTKILGNYDEVMATVTYLDTGIVTKNTSEKVINELIYLDKTKEKAKVILYKDLKRVGTLEYNKDKITKLDLEFREGLDLKYYINKEQKVTIKADNVKYSILVYPIFKKGENFDFTDFLDAENLFMNRHFDASADFYLDKAKNPISTCNIKNGKPFNGTVIGYYEKEKIYSYKEYKDGRRVKKVSDLSKKQLIKALK